MDKILKWIENHKKQCVLICCIIIVVPILATHGLFKWHSGQRWLEAEWTAGEALSYFGDILTFIGTVVLGYIAIFQTQKANKINEKFLAIEEEKQKPYFDVLTTELYKIYLNDKIYEQFWTLDRAERMIMQIIYESQPRSGITEDLALIELQVVNRGGSDITNIFVRNIGFYMSVDEPCVGSKKLAILTGNTALSVNEKRTLYLYIKHEILGEEGKLAKWYADNTRKLMPHMEIELELVARSGRRYLEKLVCGSNWDAGMQGSEFIAERQIAILKNNVEELETQ